MRRWFWLLLVALVLIGHTVLTNFGAARALANFAARPVLSLIKDGTRIPVQQSGRAAAEGEASFQGGTGVYFGYRMPLILPGGEVVTCTIRFETLTCDGGWTAERAAPP